MALFKSMLSIRSMIGAGIVLATLLPTKIVMVLAALMTLPQFILTLARHYGLEADPEKYGYIGSANYISANPHTNLFFVVQYWRNQE